MVTNATGEFYANVNGTTIIKVFVLLLLLFLYSKHTGDGNPCQLHVASNDVMCFGNFNSIIV